MNIEMNFYLFISYLWYLIIIIVVCHNLSYLLCSLKDVKEETRQGFTADKANSNSQ